jgi:hypothetical protein
LPPQAVERKVVRPDEIRGHQVLSDSPNPPPASLKSIGPERLPELPGRSVHAEPEERTLLESDASLAQTALPTDLAGSVRHIDTAPGNPPDRPAPMLLMAGIGVAIAVIIAAVLLIAGVL